MNPLFNFFNKLNGLSISIIMCTPVFCTIQSDIEYEDSLPAVFVQRPLYHPLPVETELAGETVPTYETDRITASKANAYIEQPITDSGMDEDTIIRPSTHLHNEDPQAERSSPMSFEDFETFEWPYTPSEPLITDSHATTAHSPTEPDKIFKNRIEVTPLPPAAITAKQELTRNNLYAHNINPSEIPLTDWFTNPKLLHTLQSHNIFHNGRDLKTLYTTFHSHAINYINDRLTYKAQERANATAPSMSRTDLLLRNPHLTNLRIAAYDLSAFIEETAERMYTAETLSWLALELSATNMLSQIPINQKTRFLRALTPTHTAFFIAFAVASADVDSLVKTLPALFKSQKYCSHLIIAFAAEMCNGALASPNVPLVSGSFYISYGLKDAFLRACDREILSNKTSQIEAWWYLRALDAYLKGNDFVIPEEQGEDMWEAIHRHGHYEIPEDLWEAMYPKALIAYQNKLISLFKSAEPQVHTITGQFSNNIETIFSATRFLAHATPKAQIPFIISRLIDLSIVNSQCLANSNLPFTVIKTATQNNLRAIIEIWNRRGLLDQKTKATILNTAVQADINFPYIDLLNLCSPKETFQLIEPATMNAISLKIQEQSNTEIASSWPKRLKLLTLAKCPATLNSFLRQKGNEVAPANPSATPLPVLLDIDRSLARHSQSPLKPQRGVTKKKLPPHPRKQALAKRRLEESQLSKTQTLTEPETSEDAHETPSDSLLEPTLEVAIKENDLEKEAQFLLASFLNDWIDAYLAFKAPPGMLPIYDIFADPTIAPIILGTTHISPFLASLDKTPFDKTAPPTDKPEQPDNLPNNQRKKQRVLQQVRTHIKPRSEEDMANPVILKTLYWQVAYVCVHQLLVIASTEGKSKDARRCVSLKKIGGADLSVTAEYPFVLRLRFVSRMLYSSNVRQAVSELLSVYPVAVKTLLGIWRELPFLKAVGDVNVDISVPPAILPAPIQKSSGVFDYTRTELDVAYSLTNISRFILETIAHAPTEYILPEDLLVKACQELFSRIALLQPGDLCMIYQTQLGMILHQPSVLVVLRQIKRRELERQSRMLALSLTGNILSETAEYYLNHAQRCLAVVIEEKKAALVQ